MLIAMAESAPRVPDCVLYDDGCSFCCFQMRLITWLDWFNRFRMVPISHPEVASLAPGLSQHALLEAMHCVTMDGRIYRGARAIRFLSLRMPLAFLLGLVMYIPGVIWIAERVYAWVSRNRYWISRWFGCQGACAVLPPRERGIEPKLETPPSSPRG